MSHKGTESFAIRPHSEEAANLENLIPQQLRGTAKNLLELLKEYYMYLNESGIPSVLAIKGGGTGDRLSYKDINQSDQIVGLDVTGFTPAGYNQKYYRDLNDERRYIGIADSNYVIERLNPEVSSVDVNSSSGELNDVWVLKKNDSNRSASNLEGKIDFYDKNWDFVEQTKGSSKSNDLSLVTFTANPSGSLIPNATLDSSGFRTGKIVVIALSNAVPPTLPTEEITFSDVKTIGGGGQNLRVNIRTYRGQVTTITVNNPGWGYRVGQDIRLADEVLSSTLYEITSLVSSPSNIVRRILDEHDIDKTSAEYLDRIGKEIAVGVPNANRLDRKALYKKIVEYYNTRGSEESITSFFKIFFDEVASVTYPKDQLFKPSDNVYQGTSAVSPTKEKYMYKKGYELGRRIAFLNDNRYSDVRLGTYFLDFEIGKSYTLVNEASIDEKSRYTPLFSATNKSGSEFSIQKTLNGTVGFYISTIGTLVIYGRFGSDESNFKYTKTGYWDVNFDENNNTKRRIKLALNINIVEDQANKNLVGLGLSNSPVVNKIASDSPDIEASGTFHIGPVQMVLNTITGSGTGNEFYNVLDTSLDDSPHTHHFEIERFFGQSDNSPAGATVFETVGSNSPTYGNKSAGRSTKNINLYPSSIGHGINGNHMGSTINDTTKVNSGGEVYYYGFAFVNRFCTTSELQSYANSGKIPQDNIIDVDFDNLGRSTFFNRDTSSIVAKQVTGDITTTTPAITETNFGLSSTGSEYPRFVSFLNKKGFLSDVNKIHDGFRYQEFSYVVRTALSVDKWEAEFNKIVHPAGLKFFVALYLEGISERDDPQFKNKLYYNQSLTQAQLEDEGEIPQYKFANSNYLTDLAKDRIYGHTPKYQPGWLEAAFNVPIEIILNRLLSAFYVLEQRRYLEVGDKFYNFDGGLRIRQPKLLGTLSTPKNELSLQGNVKKAIIDTTNYDEGYVELSGNGTALRTSGRVDENSVFELSFKILGDFVSTGEYIAGASWIGTDGFRRRFFIRRLSDDGTTKQVSIHITDGTDGASFPSALTVSMNDEGFTHLQLHASGEIYKLNPTTEEWEELRSASDILLLSNRSTMTNAGLPILDTLNSTHKTFVNTISIGSVTYDGAIRGVTQSTNSLASSNIQVNYASLTGSAEGNFVYRFNEGSGITGLSDTPISTLPRTSDPVYTKVITETGMFREETPVVIDAGGNGNDGTYVRRSGIRDVRRPRQITIDGVSTNSTTINNNQETDRIVGTYGPYPVGNDSHLDTPSGIKYTPSTGSGGFGAEIKLHVIQGSLNTFTQVEVTEPGINFEPGDTFTINDWVAGPEGYNGGKTIKMEIDEICEGDIQYKANMDDATNQSDIFLTRLKEYAEEDLDINPYPDVDSYTDHMMYSPETGEGIMTTSYDEHVELSRLGFRHSPIERGLYDTPTTVETTDDYRWQTGVEYQVNFDVTKYLDRNNPANLYLGGTEIGHYETDMTVGIPGSKFYYCLGNPNATFSQEVGTGPHEVFFNSNVEGMCRIEFDISEAEDAWLLALNGHILTVKQTNFSTTMSQRTFDIEDWKGNNFGQLQYNKARPARKRYSYVTYKFESDKLLVGQNCIQVFRRPTGDGTATEHCVLKVYPAGNNGLITEGSNSHTIRFDNNYNKPALLTIDHDISERKRRRGSNQIDNSELKNTLDPYDLKEYHYELDNITVRELRKVIYSSRFQPVVTPPPAIDPLRGNESKVDVVGGKDSYQVSDAEGNLVYLAGKPEYRPVDVSGERAVDYLTSFGSKALYVPVLDVKDSVSGVGQTTDTDSSGVAVPRLGVPQGPYNVIKMVANAEKSHGIIIGGSDNPVLGTFQPFTEYEITAEVFIPTTNSKLSEVHVLAGFNPPETTDEGEYVFDSPADQTPRFTYPEGKNQQIRTPYVGWDFYGLAPNAKVTTTGSWQSVTHRFSTDDLTTDNPLVSRFPQIAFVTNKGGENFRSTTNAYDISDPTVTAEGDFFMLRNIKIKEGANPLDFPFKKPITSKYSSLVTLKDNVDYELESSVNTDSDRTFVTTDVTFGNDNPTYTLRDVHRTRGEFNLKDLESQESNLLAPHLPFKVRANIGNLNIDDSPYDSPRSKYEDTKFVFLGNPRYDSPIVTSYNPVPDSPRTTTFENAVSIDVTPFNGRDNVWVATNRDTKNDSPATIPSQHNSPQQDDGGFKTPMVIIDPSKTYRMSCWIKHTDSSFADGVNSSPRLGGIKMFGWEAFDENNNILGVRNVSNNVETTTPFFLNDFNLGNRSITSDYPQFYNDQWFLVVGHINPFGTRAVYSDKDESGIYLPTVNGTKLRVLHSKSADSPMTTFNSPASTLLSGDWLNRSDTKKMRLVAKGFGNPTGRRDQIKFYAPRIDEINGSEPSIKELTSGDVVYNRPPNRDVYNIPITSWNDKIHNTRNTLISDKKHAIENNIFDIKINETHENYNFADYVSGTAVNNIGIEDTIITVEIASGSTAITIPIVDLGTNLTLCNIDWGDGTVVSITSGADSNLTHTYSSTGTFTITITGLFYKIDTNAKGGSTGVTNFESKVRTFYLGSAPVEELEQAFDGCTGLTTFTTAKGVTNTSGVTNLTQMFNGCTGLTTVDVTGMDTSNVTTMYQMFKNVGTVTITGLHTFSLKSIEVNNAASGLADMFDSATCNVEEHERALIAWSNDTETPDTVYYDMGSSQYGFGNSLASGSSVPVVNNAAEKLFNTKSWIETPAHPTNRDASR